MEQSVERAYLGWEDLIHLADMFQRAGERNIPILGGEPSLHPQFLDMVLYVLNRGFKATVFTTGVFSESLRQEAAKAFSDVPGEQLTFVCNINDPRFTPVEPAQALATERFLDVFGGRVVPGFNIYHADFDLAFLCDLINRFGLRRGIRLGIAHPIPGRQTAHLTLEQLDSIIERIFTWAPLFERLRVQPGLDCGFPLCRFTDAQLGWLYRHTGGRSQFSCGPVLDIGPDMTVWSCFPLSDFHKRSVFEFDDLPTMIGYYRDLHTRLRVEQGGIYEACDGCAHRQEGLCQGGCVAHALANFRSEEPVRMKEIYG